LTPGSLEDEVALLTEAGARLVAIREDPDTMANPDRWAVMLDLEGNEFCVTSSRTFTGWA
jgi:hypothetical protein